MHALISELTELVGESGLVSDAALAERATSYWNSDPTTARALVKPASTQEVSAILKYCHDHDQTVVVQGGLTGVVAGCEASEADVIVSLERMNQIEEIDDIENVATVQAGVILQNLHEALEPKGLLFPLDLGARGSCTVGGNVATNAGGINVLRYGMMRNLVLGLEVVLMDGTVLSSMYPMLKNNTGYDLKQLFIGSEGTLGVVTRIMVRLFPQPTSRQSAMVALDSFDKVMTLLNRLQGELAGTLSAFEVMWQNYYEGVTGEGQHRPPLARDYPFYTIIEAEGFDEANDAARFERLLENAFEDGLVSDAVIAQSERERQDVWIVREEFDPILPAYLYDVSLPIKHMNDYAVELDQRLRSELAGTYPVVFGHIADGNLHIFVLPYKNDEHHHAADQVLYETLAKYGGSVSAEHGIGIEKRAWLSMNRSEDELMLMRNLKQVLDPKHLLNPGRVFA